MAKKYDRAKRKRCKRGVHDYKKVNQYMKICTGCEKRVKIGFGTHRINTVTNISGRKRR